MNKSIVVAILILAFLMVSAVFTPALAKNPNLPPDASDVVYMGGEGSAVISIPDGSIKATATQMRISVHIDDAPSKYAGVRLWVSLYEIPPFATTPSWQPWVELMTNDELAPLIRDFWSGTAIEYDVAILGITEEPLHSLLSADNVYVVGDDKLSIERHGNNIRINLAASQQVKIPGVFPTQYWTLPSFSMELNAYGGSWHKELIYPMSGWAGAWGGTLISDEMGFDAKGTFTCSALNYDDVAMTEGWIVMNGKQTFYPPA